mgnify:CR=1 FL=1
MHRHDEALGLLLFQQRSLEAALRYCETVVRRDNDKDQQVYARLLHLQGLSCGVMRRLLHVPNDVSDANELKAKYFEASFQVLDRFHALLRPEEVLGEYPPDTPMEKLFPFVQQTTTSLTETLYNTRMKYNLIMSDYMDVGKETVGEA